MKSVLDEALAMQADRRQGFLARVRSEDLFVGEEARSLLEAHQGAGEGSSLESPFIGEAVLPPIEDPDRKPSLPIGRRIGVYELLGELGQGGMGTVYLAERSDGLFQRKVAIKVLRQGVGAESEQRFLEERRILARLDHPNIAHLLDAGTTDEQQPYLVMEYVEGRHLTTYCDEEQLGLEARLELFGVICESVQYAHGQLVIHRDLKPGNILVTGDGQVKLLDFGIAKLLEDADPEAALTRTALRHLTLAYASPEQLQGRPVTVLSDVYSLGLLLYELLCGHRPLDLTQASVINLESQICRTDPPPPSRRLREEGSEAMCRARSSSIEGLERHLRGDLDLIVMKALRKEPERRYSSAGRLLDDLCHFREGLPILARPGTRRYRLGKFWRRNRAALVSAALILLALVAGLIATAHQARQANRRFDELRGLSNSLLVDLHDEIADLQGTVRMRELIVAHGLQSLDALNREAGDDPGLLLELAEAHRRIGEMRGDPRFVNLGDLDAAGRHYFLAIELRERLLALNPDDVESRRTLADLHDRLGLIHAWAKGHTQALASNARALDLMEALLAENPDDPELRHDLARFRADRAWILIWSNGIREGAEILAEVEPELSALARDYPERLDFQLSLWDYCLYAGDAHRYQGDLPASRAVLARGLTHLCALRDRYPDHPRVLTSLRTCLIGVGELQENPAPELAYASYAEGLAIVEQQLRRDPEDREARRGYASLLGAQGSVLQRLGRFDEAEEHMLQAFDMKRALHRAFPENESYVGTFSVSHWRLTHLYLELDRHEQSLAYAGELVDLLAPPGEGELRSDIEDGLLAMAQGLKAQVFLDRVRGGEYPYSRRDDLSQAIHWYGLSLDRYARQKTEGRFMGENAKNVEVYEREREEVLGMLGIELGESDSHR